MPRFPRVWEYESKARRTGRLTRDFIGRARRSGFHESVRGSMKARGLDPDIVPSLSAPASVNRPLADRPVIREVVPETDVRSTERSIRLTEQAKPEAPPSRGLLGKIGGAVKDVAAEALEAAGPVLEVLSILDIPRREVGKPIARVALEPLALTVDAINAISPVDVPVTGGQIRGGTAVEVMSYITDPLNVALFPGVAIKGAKAALLLGKAGAGARLTLKESAALRKAVPKARGLLAEEAGGRAPKKPPIGREITPAAKPVKLTEPVIVKESPEVKALRAKVGGEGHNPPPPPPPRLPGEPSGLIPGDQSLSESLWRTIENGLFLSPRASNLMRRVGETMGQAPGLRLFFKALTGPASLARIVPEIRAGVTYQVMWGRANAVLNQRLVGQVEDFNQLFKLGKDTSKAIIGGKEVAFGDFAEDVIRASRIGAPRGRYPATAAQREWVLTQKTLIDDLARQYEFVTGEKLGLEAPDYWPRFVLGDDGRVRMSRRIGAKQSPVKDRKFQEMEESINRGTPYTAPTEAVKLYGQALQKMTLDKLLIQVVKKDKIGKPMIRGWQQQVKAIKAQIKSAKPTNLDEIQEVEVLRNKASNLQAAIAAKKRDLIPAKQALGPGFGKELMEPEALRVIQEIIGPGLGGKPGKLLRSTEWAANMVRFVVTGSMDIGQYFLQGVTLLATDPAGWGRAVGQSLRAMADPAYWPQYLRTSPEALDAARYGIGRGGIDILEITKRSAALGRLPGAEIVKRSVGRVPLGFEVFIEAGRISNFSALARIQRAAAGVAPRGLLPTTGRSAAGIAKGEVEGELFRIAGYVKTKLGTTDLMSLGLSTTQRSAEAGIAFYSPRYTRSIFGMLGWAVSNGVPARDAQKALATMLFGGSAAFYGFGRAMGLSHEDIVSRLNPTNRRFMTLPIGPNEYGIGGAYRSLVGFLGQLSKEDNWDFDTWEDAAFDNPIARYLRSRTAPTTGTLVDFIEGEDFMGQDVSVAGFIEDPARLLDYAQDRFLPLNMEALLEARGPLETKVLAGLTETVGGRSFPRSPFSLFQEAQEKVFQEKKALGEQPYTRYDSYEDMAKEHAPAAAVINTDPRVQQAQERLEHESRFRRKDREQIGFEKLEETRVLQREQQLEDDRALQGGEVTVPLWKEDFRNRQREFFSRRDQIVQDFKLKFGKDRAGVNAVIEEYFNVDIDDYPSILDGGTDWDRFFAAREEVLSTLTSTDRGLVNSYLHRYDTPAVSEFRKAQKDLGEYWAIEDLVWSRLQERPEFADFPTYNDYLTTKTQSLLDSGVPLEETSRTLSRLAIVSRLTSAISELRFRHRIANPSTDALLVKWYGLVPASEQRRRGGGRAQRLAR